MATKLFSVATVLLLAAGAAQAQLNFNSTSLPAGLDYAGAFSAAIIVADINNDGRADILYNSGAATPITYLQNNSNGTFSPPSPNPFSNYTANSPSGTVFNLACTLADFDNDGDLDVWVRVSGGTAVSPNDVYLINNNGTYITSTPINGMEYTGTGVVNVKVADINGDGYPDIIYNGGAGTAVTYLQNNNGTSFSTPSPNPFGGYVSTAPTGTVFNQNTDIADFDGDGDLDVWVRISGGTSASPNDVFLLNDNGTYVTTPVLPGMEFTSSATGSVKVADMDGDGLVDFFYSTGSAAPLVFLKNYGGSFGTPSHNPLGAYASGTPTGVQVGNYAAVADFDGDGDLDLWIRLPNSNDDFYLTAAGTPPGTVSTTPAHQASDIPVNTDLSIEFSENVFAGTGYFQIRRLSDNSVVEAIQANGANVAGSGTTTITISPTNNLSPGTDYYITFDRLALADADGLIPGSLNQDLKVREPETTSGYLSFTTLGTLPVTLVDFTASRQGTQVSLYWETSFELNARNFILQHSTDAETWQTIATVPAIGNSNVRQQYSYIHKSPAAAMNFYRLVQTDLDGATQFSLIRTVRNSSKIECRLFPNPAKAAVRIETDLAGIKQVCIYNAAGILVYKGKFQAKTFQLPVSQLPNGVYHVLITNGQLSIEQTLVKK